MTELLSCLRGKFGSPPWTLDIAAAACVTTGAPPVAAVPAAAGCAGAVAAVVPSSAATAAGSGMVPPGSQGIGRPLRLRYACSAAITELLSGLRGSGGKPPSTPVAVVCSAIQLLMGG